MMNCYIILACLFSLSYAQVHGLTSVHNKSVFLRDGIENYCDMSCGTNTKHTLCEPTKRPSNNCINFLYYDEDDYKTILWHAHNGLRDRFARKLRVSDMRRMEWDDELALMAKYWLMRCPAIELDPCARLKEKDLAYARINQNIVYLKSKYRPQYFFQWSLRNWFKEINKKEFQWINETVLFKVQKNYTNIIRARSWRIGCAAGRYNAGYALICNYYYDSSPIDDLAWYVGQPCARCPRNLPLCSLMFENLCTADIGNIVQVPNSTLLYSFIFFILLTF